MRRLKSLVPLALRIKAHTLARNVSSVARDISFLPRRVSHRLRGTPLPSGNLIYLITHHRNADIFLRSGEVSAQQIRDILKRNGVELERFNAILDFGCGVGRVIRQWKTLRGPEVYGTDYNPVLVEWCRKHLTFAQFRCINLRLSLAMRTESSISSTVCRSSRIYPRS